MKKKYIIVLSLLFGMIFFVSIYFISNKYIYFSLNGNDVVNLNIDEKYEEEGYKAEYCTKFKFFCKDISNYVKITNNEKDNKLFINYTLNYDNIKKTLYREIVYIDKESPEIKLIDNKNSLCPNKEYIEEGYSAFDNIDGDITNKVQKTVQGNKIFYSVEDSSGNKKIVMREIKYNDETAPVINLNGSEVIYNFINHEYIDPGYTVQDDCDGDLSKSVELEGEVDINTTGEYNIKYIIKDSSNNISSVSRKVIVYDDLSDIPKNGKVVYLTFDDGPGGYTEEILNVLEKYNVKATFFVTNQFSDYKYLIKKEYESGHTVAVHTYSHNYKKIYSSVDDFLNDYNSMNNIIYEQTGNYSSIFRFPGGSSNTISRFNKGIMSEIISKTNELGYIYFDWNVDSMDTSIKEADKIANNVINEIKKNNYSIVLMHDIKKANIESVDKIISYGLNNGYTFLPLDTNSPLVQHKTNN